MSTRRLVVVSAGLSQPSATRLLADRLSSATVDALRDRDVQPDVEVIELREHAQDLTNNLLTGFPSPGLRAAVASVVAADGLIAVSPIFSASYSGLFKTFFDVLERDGLAGKPTLVAATGGTARHSLALDHAFRPLFSYMNAATVPTAVFAAAEDWGEGDTDTEPGLAERIVRAADELATAIAARVQPESVDPFEAPIPFERLLRGER
ncbi:MAG: FMN reductase [Candidatus Limnocylindrales bacterium]